MTMSSSKIGIIGLGLIGGSIARALKRSDGSYIIKAWDTNADNIKNALSDKAIDEYAISLKDDFFDCDVVFLCVPVFAMREIINEIRDSLSPKCILTDVGSTKSDVAQLVDEMKLKNYFIGGHPLAGSEKSGFSASRANLFENAYYCLTPTKDTNKDILNTLRKIVTEMGAIPIEISPEEHDRVVAAISHVPHVIAALLVNLIGKLDGPDNIMKTIAAGGFKDLTRIASSSPGLWAGICMSNKEIILETLNLLGEELKRFEADLKSGKKENMESFFASARDLRSAFAEGKSIFQKTFDITVDVDDRPGIIAEIASALAKKNINIKNIGILNNRESEDGALEIQFENEGSRLQGLETLNAMGYMAKPKE